MLRIFASHACRNGTGCTEISQISAIFRVYLRFRSNSFVFFFTIRASYIGLIVNKSAFLSLRLYFIIFCPFFSFYNTNCSTFLCKAPSRKSSCVSPTPTVFVHGCLSFHNVCKSNGAPPFLGTHHCLLDM